ncbi:hypothetical protein CEXT_567191 [Caerostris extrusa]|uniref:Uncharacterized protein n=1 Tax=Caerostris extrusa TaxID=172846 RepID=A0AAV4QA22_CAEEX|nr:hypothetical protein CEXT_567191 [Caerostris extrusa]
MLEKLYTDQKGKSNSVSEKGAIYFPPKKHPFCRHQKHYRQHRIELVFDQRVLLTLINVTWRSKLVMRLFVTCPPHYPSPAPLRYGSLVDCD